MALLVKAVADTHAALWFLWSPERLSANATRCFADSMEAGIRVGISAITLCEVVYLVERNRIDTDAHTMLLDAIQAQDGPFAELPVTSSVAAAMREGPCRAIPDMPDRIIAATAAAYQVPLITKDHVISKSGLSVVW